MTHKPSSELGQAHLVVIRRASSSQASQPRVLVLSAGCIHSTLLSAHRWKWKWKHSNSNGGMAAEGKRKGVPALGWWLMLVGSLRLASVWFGFFDIWALRVAVFSQTESECPPRILPLPSRFTSSPLCLSFAWTGSIRVGGTDLISPGRGYSLICAAPS